MYRQLLPLLGLQSFIAAERAELRHVLLCNMHFFACMQSFYFLPRELEYVNVFMTIAEEEFLAPFGTDICSGEIIPSRCHTTVQYSRVLTLAACVQPLHTACLVFLIVLLFF